MKPYYDHAGISIYHGDCLEVLPSLLVDSILTDPPYGIGESRRRVMSRRREASPRDYGDFEWDSEPASSEEIMACLYAASQVIIWGGNYFQLPPSAKWLVWNKLNSGDFADCELAWTNLPGAIRKFDFLWNGMIREGRERGVPRVHPTQKPVALMKWCLSQLKPGIVCDPFMGSGSTLVAAKDMRSQCIGIEIDERNCEIAATRLSQEVLELYGRDA